MEEQGKKEGKSLPWHRVDNDFVDHPKTFALEERLGDKNAGMYVARLWSYTMRYAARGRHGDGAGTALERAMRWDGERGALIAALIDTGWLDASGDGGLEVHDWDEYQGAAVAKAEKDAERKRNKRERRGDGAETARANREESERTARVTERNGTERDIQTTTSVAVATELALEVQPPPDTRTETQKLEDAMTDDEFDVFAEWAQLYRPKAVPTVERRRLIAKWLKVYSVEQLQCAIRGVQRSPHHMGHNDRRTKYDGLELILRDAEHIEKFMRLTEEAA